MKTILKFAVYVEIDTDNVDRANVTRAANTILYPNLIRYLSSAKYKGKILEDFRSAAKVNFASVRLLTESDLVKQLDSN